MNTLEQQLKQHGVKPTRQRVLVLEMLSESKQRHFTAEQLYMQQQAQGNEMGLATVYRVLNDFSNAGMLRRNQLTQGQGKTYFELADGEPHIHLVDTDEGKIVELQDDELMQQINHAVAHLGYKIVDFQLNVFVKAAS